MCVCYSEGSVIAYYLSEFEVPRGQEAAVDKAMSSMDKVVAKVQRGLPNSRPGNDLLFEDVMNSALDSRMFSESFSGEFCSVLVLLAPELISV